MQAQEKLLPVLRVSVAEPNPRALECEVVGHGSVLLQKCEQSVQVRVESTMRVGAVVKQE